MTPRLGTARRTRLASLLAVPVLALALAGCSTSGDDASSAGSRDSGEAGAPEPALVDEDGAVARDSDRSAATGTAVLTRAVVSTGSVSLRSDDIARDRASVVRVVAGAGGVVADEQSTGDDRGGLSWSSMTVRVPSERFDDTMTRVAEIGTVLEQSRSAEDVTTQVIDTDARVRAQERSVRRIEALLTQAERLGEVIAIESDLARRQADLDSLKSQQAYLADQTSLSTITVSLDQPPSADKSDDEPDGFLAGLAAGWSALGASSVVLLTALGAALPFTLALALLGVPLWLLLRRRRRAAVSEPAPARAPAPGPA